MRLLLVEDDAPLADAVRTGLEQEGYAVDWLTDGQQADAALALEPYDVLVLDLGLPKRDGLQVLRKARDAGNDVPVLVLTARDSVDDRVAGLDDGADDYLTKPFDLDELFARLRAIVRRRGGRAAPEIRHGDLVLDPTAHTLTRAGESVDLSAREFAVLEMLLSHPGRPHSRRQLEERLYAWGDEVESNAVEVYVHHLRKKLGAGLIRTIRGVGYVIDRPS